MKYNVARRTFQRLTAVDLQLDTALGNVIARRRLLIPFRDTLRENEPENRMFESSSHKRFIDDRYSLRIISAISSMYECVIYRNYRVRLQGVQSTTTFLGIMRSLERLSGSDQDCDQEMYIDLDDASVDSLTGKRSRHHVVGAEVSTFLSSTSLPYFFFSCNLAGRKCQATPQVG